MITASDARRAAVTASSRENKKKNAQKRLAQQTRQREEAAANKVARVIARRMLGGLNQSIQETANRGNSNHSLIVERFEDISRYLEDDDIKLFRAKKVAANLANMIDGGFKTNIKVHRYLHEYGHVEIGTDYMYVTIVELKVSW
ncbi:MAG: hypothetical protein A2915_01885 [Candidatus Yanofskybacteria bacterium RIFCSPLOWO2_01_FULL_41_34]|uniref:Uncharacterized protein n=1 Tax=Candidatus Yanofskybacteria bacterium RIFCSPHIGHO2_01_FULL_41_26 TaxID=1802661 RepID=A0A1F8EC91_9BACT|nr:MAG: hypothetical protein A2649_00415 [Candidatus Yanofskybacteria bacterium RIFCSPHIGHO2_01_FULL_41_26]OGN22984.1 MAG: hypothetical protein A2915_01885 [Candidatus Yanofskybacteria bacterium RIFCSPLOWO2_01_FULL_41_34]